MLYTRERRIFGAGGTIHRCQVEFAGMAVEKLDPGAPSSSRGAKPGRIGIDNLGDPRILLMSRVSCLINCKPVLGPILQVGTSASLPSAVVKCFLG